MLWEVSTLRDVIGVRDHVVVVSKLVPMPIVKITSAAQYRINVRKGVLHISHAEPFPGRASVCKALDLRKILMLTTLASFRPPQYPVAKVGDLEIAAHELMNVTGARAWSRPWHGLGRRDGRQRRRPRVGGRP